MLFALVSVLLNACAQLTLKKATSFSNSGITDLFKNPFLYLTGFFYMTSIVTWYLALSRVPLSVGYPLQALGYLIVTIAAVLVFREQVNTLNWIGLLVIVLGVFMTQMGKVR
jgi:multidrug transporter EmrE-like cation transporter